MDGADIHDEVLDMIREFAKNNVYDAVDDKVSFEEWNIEKINNLLNNRVLPADFNYVTEDMIEGLEAEELADKVAEKAVVEIVDKTSINPVIFLIIFHLLY